MRLVVEASGYRWHADKGVIEVDCADSQAETLREQLGADPREKRLLAKAVERLVERLIGEKIDAQVALRELQMTGHKCGACGTYTKTVAP